jgi:aspartyl-tRNA(Asn)/glutamyl-tRNA(Gln) amidotransferase subunit A
MEGVLPLSANLDSIGPLAPSVRCCATLDAILSGEPLEELHAAPLQGLRLLAPTNVVLDGMDATVAAAWERALSLLSQAGAQITHAVVAPFGELADINAKGGFTAAEAWAWHRHHIATRLSEYDPRVARASCAARRSARPTTSTCWHAAGNGLPPSARRWPTMT